MKMWVLGSGTLRPDPNRGSPGYWVEVGEERILLDCGSGTLRTMARLRLQWEQVSRVFLSHFHTDHVGDLAPLLFALKHGTGGFRVDRLTLLGPPGRHEHMGALARAHGMFILDPGFPLDVVEIVPGGGWSPPNGVFRLSTRATPHSDSSLACRLEAEDGVIGYTGDTGPDPSLGDFLAGCHLLVAECSSPDGLEAGNHLTPATLRDLASRAEPELLVTVHAYPPLEARDVPDLLRASGYRGRVLAGEDGMAFSVEDGSVRMDAGGG